MTALDQLTAWPVNRCAAAVVTPAGIIAAAGDLAEPFVLASLTKPLAAVAALVAVQEGAIGLDDPLGGPLIDASLAAELPGVTLRHLLAHASGMAPEAARRSAAPGTRRIYSNAAFDVLGDVVARASTIAFADYLAEGVFGPLGMTTATLHGSPAKDGAASVSDYSAFVSELLGGGRVLDPTTVRQLSSVQFPGLDGVLPGYGRQQPNDWGLGFELRASKRPHWTSVDNSPATYGHFGRSGTMFWIDPTRSLGLVALADRDFDEWAIQAWPRLSEAVLAEFG